MPESYCENKSVAEIGKNLKDDHGLHCYLILFWTDKTMNIKKINYETKIGNYFYL